MQPQLMNELIQQNLAEIGIQWQAGKIGSTTSNAVAIRRPCAGSGSP